MLGLSLLATHCCGFWLEKVQSIDCLSAISGCILFVAHRSLLGILGPVFILNFLAQHKGVITSDETEFFRATAV